jgi:cobalt-zinc-cadmium efflux system membrane fusion protein
MSGLVEASPEDFAAVSAPISGRIARVLAHEGEAVRRGQTVAVIESLEFASLVADLMQAEAEADLQRQQVARYTQLVAERISPQMRLDQARADLRRAEAAVQGARARLSAVGVGESAVREAARSGRVRVSVAAPRSGLIDRHSIDLGGAVMAYDEMMTIVGQSEVMVRGQASPDQAARIRPGDGVSVRSAADSSVAVAGRVSSIAPAATADDRAVAVYVRLPAGRGLRPGQSVRLSVVTRDAAPGLEVPLAAISYDGDRAVVFVQTGPRAYELRPVVLGAAGEASVGVRDGLRPGERVAVSNVFDLKALTRFDPEAE